MSFMAVSSRKGRWRMGAAAGIAVLVPLGMTSCADPSQPESPRAITSTSLNAVYQRILGDSTKRRAGKLISYHKEQDAAVTCLRDAGFSYTPPPFVDPPTGYASSLGPETWFTSLKSTSIINPVYYTYTAERAAAEAGQEPPNPGYENLDEAGKRAYSAALEICNNRGNNGTDSPFPAGATALLEKFMDILRQVENSSQMKALTDTYAPCMAQAGFNVTNPQDLWDQIGPLFFHQHPAGAGVPASTGWGAAVARDRAAAAADSSCRGDVLERSLLLLAGPLATFVAEQASELTLVDQRWEQLIERASSYPEW